MFVFLVVLNNYTHDSCMSFDDGNLSKSIIYYSGGLVNSVGGLNY